MQDYTKTCAFTNANNITHIFRWMSFNTMPVSKYDYFIDRDDSYNFRGQSQSQLTFQTIERKSKHWRWGLVLNGQMVKEIALPSDYRLNKYKIGFECNNNRIPEFYCDCESVNLGGLVVLIQGFIGSISLGCPVLF